MFAVNAGAAVQPVGQPGAGVAGLSLPLSSLGSMLGAYSQPHEQLRRPALHSARTLGPRRISFESLSQFSPGTHSVGLLRQPQQGPY